MADGSGNEKPQVHELIEHTAPAKFPPLSVCSKLCSIPFPASTSPDDALHQLFVPGGGSVQAAQARQRSRRQGLACFRWPRP